MKPQHPPTQPIVVGTVTVRQVGGQVRIEHRGKAGRVVTVDVDEGLLLRWAMRVLRQQAFQ